MSTESQGNPPPQGGQGSGAPGASSGGEGSQSFAFKSEDEFNERINRAITGRFKDFEKKVDGRFAEVQTGITGFSSRFDELGKTLEGLKPKEDPAKSKDKGVDPAFKLEELPEWKAQQEALRKRDAEFAALKKEADEARAARDQERAKNRESHLRSTLSEHLARYGNVSASSLKAAIALLYKEEGRIAYSDGGNGDALVWRGPDGEELPLEEGIKRWARTVDAKQFQPAVNPKGSGGSRGNAGSGVGGGDSVNDVLSAAITASLKT